MAWNVQIGLSSEQGILERKLRHLYKVKLKHLKVVLTPRLNPSSRHQPAVRRHLSVAGTEHRTNRSTSRTT